MNESMHNTSVVGMKPKYNRSVHWKHYCRIHFSSISSQNNTIQFLLGSVAPYVMSRTRYMNNSLVTVINNGSLFIMITMKCRMFTIVDMRNSVYRSKPSRK